MLPSGKPRCGGPASPGRRSVPVARALRLDVLAVVRTTDSGLKRLLKAFFNKPFSSGIRSPGEEIRGAFAAPSSPALSECLCSAIQRGVRPRSLKTSCLLKRIEDSLALTQKSLLRFHRAKPVPRFERMRQRQLRRRLPRSMPVICFFGTCLLSAIHAWAHDPGLSVAELQFHPGRLNLHLIFARADIESLTALDHNNDGQVSPSEFAASPALEVLASEALEIRVDGQQLHAETIRPQLDESNAIHFYLDFPFTAGSRLSLNPALLARLPGGHRQILSVRNHEKKLIAERMLDAGNRGLEIDLAGLTSSQTGFRSFRQFLVLGVEHILIGYDHLVFLFGLLIVGASLSASVKIITSFTVAHSITLALATLDVVHISSSVVEPLIAASIVYVGIENIFSHNLNWRWLLTFGFGLVHGFGFASVLRELGIGSGGGGLLIPLLSFNLGVEIGQVAIAAVALPLIWKLRSQPAFAARYVPACSVLIALMGGFWLVERILPR